MQHRGCELPKTPLLGTSVNKGKGGPELLRPASYVAIAELTFKTLAPPALLLFEVLLAEGKRMVTSK